MNVQSGQGFYSTSPHMKEQFSMLLMYIYSCTSIHVHLQSNIVFFAGLTNFQAHKKKNFIRIHGMLSEYGWTNILQRCEKAEAELICPGTNIIFKDVFKGEP